MKLAEHIACICEGASENAIMDLLLDGDFLIFDRSRLLDHEVLRCRSAANFERRYLRWSFNWRLSIVRILDSRREKFRLGKAYQGKIDVYNVVTAPEIEMLIIISAGQHAEFKRSRKKPSDFCKEDLKLRKVKSYEFVKEYFRNPGDLIMAVRKYAELTKL